MTPPVPLGPASYLAGLALLDARLEVVLRVCVTGVPRKIQLLNLGHDEVVVVVGGNVRIDYPHNAPERWIVAKYEIVWIVYENLINYVTLQSNVYLVSWANFFGNIKRVVPSFLCSSIFC